MSPLGELRRFEYRDNHSCVSLRCGASRECYVVRRHVMGACVLSEMSLLLIKTDCKVRHIFDALIVTTLLNIAFV